MNDINAISSALLWYISWIFLLKCLFSHQFRYIFHIFLDLIVPQIATITLREVIHIIAVDIAAVVTPKRKLELLRLNLLGLVFNTIQLISKLSHDIHRQFYTLLGMKTVFDRFVTFNQIYTWRLFYRFVRFSLG